MTSFVQFVSFTEQAIAAGTARRANRSTWFKTSCTGVPLIVVLAPPGTPIVALLPMRITPYAPSVASCLPEERHDGRPARERRRLDKHGVVGAQRFHPPRLAPAALAHERPGAGPRARDASAIDYRRGSRPPRWEKASKISPTPPRWRIRPPRIRSRPWKSLASCGPLPERSCDRSERGSWTGWPAPPHRLLPVAPGG